MFKISGAEAPKVTDPNYSNAIDVINKFTSSFKVAVKDDKGNVMADDNGNTVFTPYVDFTSMLLYIFNDI